jgi:hypothetical protein
MTSKVMFYIPPNIDLIPDNYPPFVRNEKVINTINNIIDDEYDKLIIKPFNFYRIATDYIEPSLLQFYNNNEKNISETTKHSSEDEFEKLKKFYESQEKKGFPLKLEYIDLKMNDTKKEIDTKDKSKNVKKKMSVDDFYNKYILLNINNNNIFNFVKFREKFNDISRIHDNFHIYYYIDLYWYDLKNNNSIINVKDHSIFKICHKVLCINNEIKKKTSKYYIKGSKYNLRLNIKNQNMIMYIIIKNDLK